MQINKHIMGRIIDIIDRHERGGVIYGRFFSGIRNKQTLRAAMQQLRYIPNNTATETYWRRVSIKDYERINENIRAKLEYSEKMSQAMMKAAAQKRIARASEQELLLQRLQAGECVKVSEYVDAGRNGYLYQAISRLRKKGVQIETVLVPPEMRMGSGRVAAHGYRLKTEQ